jgi:hypothetical protein
MEKVKRYTCGAGDGMFDDKKGYYVEYSDYKILLDKYNQALLQYDVSNRREQLIAFKTWEIDNDIKNLLPDQLADFYLENSN